MKSCPKCQRSYPNTQRFCLDDDTLLALKDPYHLVGRTIEAKYRIDELVGVGGMGAVYKAYHLGIDRRVAFKILLPHLALNNEQAVSLFEREAKTTAKLAHENIATVFDAGRTADDLAYIVMEWLDGRTLDEELAACGPLSLERTAEILRQVCAALNAAHSKQIIHRDLKPANVMLVPGAGRREQVKVLDFGLAKVISETTDAPVSAAMGTPHYASPEQFQVGALIDKRADIYALGVMLFRMLTGTLPFKANSRHELIWMQMTAAPPPVRQLRMEVPEAVEQLIAWMLAKKPQQRPHSTGEVWRLFEEAIKSPHKLQVVLEEAETLPLAAAPLMASSGRDVAEAASEPRPSTAKAAIAPTTAPNRRIYLRAALLLATLAISGIVAARLLTRLWKDASLTLDYQPGSAPLSDKAVRVAISPDGKYLAYLEQNGSKKSISVRRASAGPSSEDPGQVFPPAADILHGLTFSPDNEHVYFVKHEGDYGFLYRAHIWEKNPRKLIRDVDGAVTFSPDGRQVAFYRKVPGQREEYHLVITETEGNGGERVLAKRTHPDFFSRDGFAWSPDGGKIAGGAGSYLSTGYLNLIEVRVADGAEKQISPLRWSSIGRTAWVGDGRGLIISAADEGQSEKMQLWYIAYPGGEASRITKDFYDYIGVSLAQGGKTLASVQIRTDSHFWAIPSRDFDRAKPITSGKFDGYNLSLTPEGKIVYVSKTSGSEDIWVMNTDGGNPQRLTSYAGFDYSPAVSPDGRFVVFVSDRRGAFHLWRMDTDGSSPKQLTAVGQESSPSVSPDGWVYYTSSASGHSAIWKVPINGGAPKQVIAEMSDRPRVSPDGKLLACSYYVEDQGWETAIFSLEDSMRIRGFGRRLNLVHWKDARTLTYVATESGVSNVHVQPLDQPSPQRVTSFNDQIIYSLDWSRDGKHLFCERGNDRHTAYLFTDSR